MRFVAALTSEEATQLQTIICDSGHHRERIRAQAILLSHKGYKLKQIADICEMDRDTVSSWRPSHGLPGGKKKN